MRICLFTPNFLPDTGGAERMADALCRGLLARGHQIAVLAEKSRLGPPPPLPYPVHHYRRPPAQHLWPEVLALAVWRLHRRWPFEVMLAFYAYPNGYAASLVKRQLDFALVVNPRGGDLYHTFHGLKKPRVRTIIARGYQRADRIISISGWLTQRLHEVAGNNLPPIDLVYNGLDLAAHDRMLAEAAATPPTFADGLGPPRQPFVLHLARLHPVKQHAVALTAVAQCREWFMQQGWSYVLAGDGEARPALEQQVRDLGLSSIVRFLGECKGPAKAWLLAHAELFVTSSLEEGMPNVVLEAMASGLPILASDIGPHRELIEGKGWGRLFAVGDASALARELAALLTMDRRPLREAARAGRQAFALDVTIAGYERSLQRACAARRDSTTKHP